MSAGETPKPEEAASTEPDVQQQLTINSAMGAAALLAGLYLVFGGLPTLWGSGWAAYWADRPDMLRNDILSGALLVLLDLGVIGGLTYAAYLGLQQVNQLGARAGMFFMALATVLTLWLCAWLGNMMEDLRDNPAFGWGILALVAMVLLGGFGYMYLQVPGWMWFLEAVETQGWFHAYAYKGNQGVRVRRGSIVGLLIIGGFGIYAMVQNKYFGSGGGDVVDLRWIVPFTEGNRVTYAPLMYHSYIMMPLVLSALLVWAAWRCVNIPGFADFLIATEAEMNKVSWTTRERVVQDTIVVLVTVFLFTSFLFVVDVIWIKFLSAPYIKVLLIDPKKADAEQKTTTAW